MASYHVSAQRFKACSAVPTTRRMSRREARASACVHDHEVIAWMAKTTAGREERLTVVGCGVARRAEEKGGKAMRKHVMFGNLDLRLGFLEIESLL